MNNVIKKYKFKDSSDLQVEVIDLEKLTIQKKNYIINPHRTNFYHIFLFDYCQPIHFVDFKPIQVKPYSLLFIDKDRVHQFDQLLSYNGNLLIFTEDFFCRTESDTKFLKSSILFNDIDYQPFIALNKTNFQKYSAICESITEEMMLPNDDLQPLLLKNLLQNFLIHAEREKRKQGYNERPKGADLDYTLLFRDFLEQNFMKFKTVSEYANLICISEKRLGQATAKIVGKSPKEIINDRLLLEAKRLLVHTNLTIKEIGQELGFEDPAYFARYFKKNSKNTPVKFREIYFKK